MPASDTQRFWMFTLNFADPTTCWLPTLADLGKYGRFLVCQEEQGDKGTYHIQGYFELSRGVRLSAVKKMIPGAHFEIRRGTAEQAIAYCTKEETRLAGPYREGVVSLGPGTRTDIRDTFNRIKSGLSTMEIAEADPGTWFRYQRGIQATQLLYGAQRNWKTEVYYCYGTTGVGKSKYAAQMAPNAYYKPANDPWFDGYANHADVVFDDFTAGWFKWANLLQILDRYPLRVPVKGGFTSFVARRIFITSNTRPWELYGSKEGVSKKPIGALLRRIDHYLQWSATDTWIDFGCLDPQNSVHLASLLNENL